MIKIKMAFRVDASVKMGIGHVMRTLTLANELAEKNVECLFICRLLPESLRFLILEQGHSIHMLSNSENEPFESIEGSDWLTVSQLSDAQDTVSVLAKSHWAWVIVDHYGIDQEWEKYVAPHCDKIMVIDDLADRHHYCDILLDQTLTRVVNDYQSLVPIACRLFLGPKYALLRPEFRELRADSIMRRALSPVKRVLISLGGTDARNVTGQVLCALHKFDLFDGLSVDVVLGSSSPSLDAVSSQILEIDKGIVLSIDVRNMASLMAKSDLVIGAAGTTSWERCCLGVPTIMTVLAENQMLIARAISETGAAINLGSPFSENFNRDLVDGFRHLLATKKLEKMSQKASGITQGDGAEFISVQLMGNY